VDRVGRDHDLAELHVAGHRHLDHAPAGARLDRLVLELLLGLRHLGLHLLRLLEQLVEVGSLWHQPASLSRASSGTTSLASKLSLIMAIRSSSLIAEDAGAGSPLPSTSS